MCYRSGFYQYIGICQSQFILLLVTFCAFLSGYELIHHRVTQSFTEFNQFEIKRIELRETLCYSVVKTHYYTVTNAQKMTKRSIVVGEKNN